VFAGDELRVVQEVREVEDVVMGIDLVQNIALLFVGVETDSGVVQSLRNIDLILKTLNGFHAGVVRNDTRYERVIVGLTLAEGGVGAGGLHTLLSGR